MDARLDALTYPEVRERLDRGTDLAILPLGAVEWTSTCWGRIRPWLSP